MQSKDVYRAYQGGIKEGKRVYVLLTAHLLNCWIVFSVYSVDGKATYLSAPLLPL